MNELSGRISTRVLRKGASMVVESQGVRYVTSTGKILTKVEVAWAEQFKKSECGRSRGRIREIMKRTTAQGNG